MVEIIATLLGSPITELCKCLFSPLKRQIGYIVHCKKKLEKLTKKVEELQQTTEDVQGFITAAERNLESIHKDVEAWLVEVEKETSTIDGDDQTKILGLVMSDDEVLTMINTKCCCSCGSCSRYNLGKNAEKKLAIIEKLLNDGKSFNRDNISEPCLIGENLNRTNNNQDDFVPFASREHLKDEVMAALRDERTNLIVIYGMAGVGKTMLVNQVYKHIVNKEKNLFVDIAKTVISRNADLIKIQNDIAEQLGFVDLKSNESESVRADLLSKRLMKNRALVILDDLWSPLNFLDVGIPCIGSCKVIITTRNKLDHVCTSLHNIKFVSVQVLSELDSWQLFKRMNVGGDVDLQYPDVPEETVREIVKECGGLPVAVVTLGRALKNMNFFARLFKKGTNIRRKVRKMNFSKLSEVETIGMERALEEEEEEEILLDIKACGSDC